MWNVNEMRMICQASVCTCAETYMLESCRDSAAGRNGMQSEDVPLRVPFHCKLCHYSHRKWQVPFARGWGRGIDKRPGSWYMWIVEDNWNLCARKQYPVVDVQLEVEQWAAAASFYVAAVSHGRCFCIHMWRLSVYIDRVCSQRATFSDISAWWHCDGQLDVTHIRNERERVDALIMFNSSKFVWQSAARPCMLGQCNGWI